MTETSNTWTHIECESAGRPLTEEIARDHETLKQCYEQYKAANTSEDQQKWANQFIWTNVRHAISEELIVYPAMDSIMGPSAKEITEKDRDAHQRVKEDLYKLQSKSATDPDFAQEFEHMFQSLWQHVLPEEKEDMPAFERCIDYDKSLELAKQFRKTQHFVPTRSHPSAPSHTPYETAAALMAAPMDKLADLFRTFPDEEEVAEKLTTGAPKPSVPSKL